MKLRLVQTIEAWFQQHADGDFVCDEPRAAYVVQSPVGSRVPVVFTTKPATVRHAIAADKVQPLGVVGRYGLPHRRDLAWIRELVGRRPLLFLGDLDPSDLMVFAWLRARLAPKRVRHLGVNDTLLQRVDARLTIRNTIALAPTELAACELLPELLEDLPTLIGPGCSELLFGGRKMELEAITRFLQRSPDVLCRS
ncbi:MAG: hypothetical protein AB7U73_04590 [Pirellulales bacterium]